MPVYEYVCRKCAHPFEELVFAGDAPPVCPACQAPEVDRVLSVVTAGRPEAAAPLRACGSCGDPRGPGACRTN